MPSRTISVTVRSPDKNLIRDVERLVKSPPPGDLGEAQQRIKTLANALLEVATHCADLQKALTTLLDSTTFEAKR